MRFEGQIAAHIESLRKHVERAESQFGECSYLNWIKFDASQFRSVSDTALTELRRALASRPLGDREERVAEYLYERDEARGEVEDWEVAAPECRESARAILSLLSGSEAAGDGWTFQADVDGWMQQCFGPEIAADTTERNYRFLEEALEVVQANGCTKEDALRLVDYTFSRAIGEPDQEVGGAMVCMAALCNAAGLSMVEAARRELARISEPAMMARIRAKHAAKEIRSPLPGAAPTPSGQEQGGGS